MPGLKLDTDELAGLTKLQALSDQPASDLLSAIKSAAIKANTDGLTIADLSEVPNLARADAAQILESLVSLYHVRAYAEVELNEFITDICDYLKATRKKDFPLSKDAIEQFRHRLTQFMGLEDVNRAAKSTVLRYEQDRTICGLRFLTDTRPIFGNDVAEPPESAVILHTLKIAYHQAGRLEEIFFSFDEHDLRELKRAIQRAEVKAASLRSMLAKAQVKVFDLE